MSVILPTSPGNVSYRIFVVSAGGVEESALGGVSQNILRGGDKWGVEVALPPMRSGDAAIAYCETLAFGRRNGVRMRWPQLGFNPGTPGAIQVNGGGQSGAFLTVDGATANYTAKPGYFFSFETGGRTYLHMIQGGNTLNGAGAGILTLVNALRVIPPDNTPLNFTQPMIDGVLAGDELGWDVNRARHYGLNFTVIER